MDRRSPRRRAVVALVAVLVGVATATDGGPAHAGATPRPAPTRAASMPERPARLVLIGDSVAASAVDALAAEAARRGIELATHTRLGCGLTDGVPVGTNNAAFSAECVRDNEAFLARAADRPVDAVIVMSSWEVNSHVVGGTRLDFRTPEWDAWMTGQLERTRARFGNVPLLLATVAPRAPLGLVATMTPDETEQVLRYDQFLRDYATLRQGEAGIIDVARILCPDDPRVCPEYLGTARPRPDLGAHFDAAGAAWFAPRVLDAAQVAWERIGAVATAPPGF